MITEWSAKAFFSGLICFFALCFFIACTAVKQVSSVDEEVVLRGKFFISFEDERWALRYRFVGLPGNGILNIRSLGGLAQSLVKIDRHHLFIYDSKTKKLIRYSDQMMKRDFGVSLPLEAMTFWISGKPKPEQEYRTIAMSIEGALMSFEQSGWTVFYDHFFINQNKKGPKKIKAVSGKTKVIVTIDS